MPDEAANQNNAAHLAHRDLPAERRDTESAIRLWQRKASEVGDSPPLSTFEFTRVTSDWGYRFLISGDEFVDASVFLTECDPSRVHAGDFVEVDIVGAREYDLIGRPVL